ncbi:MurR/RpiR family transcriptional regulator [Companilactobacillus halodurans]|uniref:MurR/RpiR family transcriptional regulator n=1 Tax=Companilactobacillus halodurans TaxID=2584183 RepID=A0A5P0ZMR4_9LACO|nr:MurR/RpiR family transcriptional regulator [Companilactobacillus halodurans]MQS75507.1 MurR/RpiR family transcriptional regulator [Companilactobacillus halodurans]MQS97751.1 MurR/RpiR family transcriptional regulator [Companilactobacillus halodurans]
MRIEELINKYSDRLTENDYQLLSIILKNKKILSNLNSKEISDIVYSSPAGLTRLAKKLNFTGFSEFKYFLKNDADNSGPLEPNQLDILINDMNDTIKLLSQTNMTPLTTYIHNAKRIYIYGTGWGEKRAADLIARNFLAYNILFYKIPAFTELEWVLNDITENDILFVISFSGENTDLNKSLKKLKLKNVPYISITPLSKNTLASRATYNMYYSTTILNISTAPNTEYNYFSPLELVADALFRSYIDTYPK